MEQNLKERYDYIKNFFDALSDDEFIKMMVECGIEKTKKPEESDYVKAFYPSTIYKMKNPSSSDNNSYSIHELKNKNFKDVA